MNSAVAGCLPGAQMADLPLQRAFNGLCQGLEPVDNTIVQMAYSHAAQVRLTGCHHNACAVCLRRPRAASTTSADSGRLALCTGVPPHPEHRAPERALGGRGAAPSPDPQAIHEAWHEGVMRNLGGSDRKKGQGETRPPCR